MPMRFVFERQVGVNKVMRAFALFQSLCGNEDATGEYFCP